MGARGPSWPAHRGDRRGGRRPARGFTVVEAVVVVMIVSVLIGLALVGLRRSQETARRAVCANNLRNLGVALLCYAVENHGWFPVEEMCGNPQQALVKGLWPEYAASRDVFYCPSAHRVERYAQSNEYGGPGGDSVINTDQNWQRQYISYKYFSITRRDPRMPLPLKPSDYPHLLRADSPGLRFLMSDWVRQHAPIFPHLDQRGLQGGGRNVLFVSGSVQFVDGQAGLSPGAYGIGGG